MMSGVKWRGEGRGWGRKEKAYEKREERRECAKDQKH